MNTKQKRSEKKNEERNIEKKNTVKVASLYYKSEFFHFRMKSFAQVLKCAVSAFYSVTYVCALMGLENENKKKLNRKKISSVCQYTYCVCLCIVCVVVRSNE